MVVRKDSYASVLFVLLINQFFLSFLVPVAIELGSESKTQRQNDKIAIADYYKLIS